MIIIELPNDKAFSGIKNNHYIYENTDANGATVNFTVTSFVDFPSGNNWLIY